MAQYGYSEIYGHRGFRGKFPENSLIGFQKAIELGITGIELDVVVNRDRQLVISHEPYFQREFCLDSSGKEIQRENEFNIYELTQSEISKFDCGTKFYSKFPDQQKIKSTKPSFQEFIEKIDLRNVILLLEIKSNPKQYNVSQPKPTEFCEFILDELKNYPIKSNVRIMSFDSQILEEIHKKDRTYPLIYLTYLPKPTSFLLKKLTFKPFGLGMFYPTINKKKVKSLHQKNIKLYAWTVNSTADKTEMTKIGVDAIITDFPDSPTIPK